MHQALERLNLKIHTVISSVIGWSGQRMIRAIVAGERDPEQLAALCDEQILRVKRADLLKALEGNWKSEHLFALKLALENWDFYQQQIATCDREIEPLLQEMAAAKPTPELGERKELRNNAPENMPHLREQLGQIYGADLAKIPGLNQYTVLQILSEIGVDMSQWPSVKHFTSWLGLAPACSQSGNRRRKQKRHGAMAGRIFCLAAQSLARGKKSWLGSFYRRLRGARSPAVALKATARKIAMLFYLVLTKGWAYVEAGIEKYEQQYRQLQMRRLQALALELNVVINLTTTAMEAKP
jgi:transposase